jgi:hypothetical protein
MPFHNKLERLVLVSLSVLMSVGKAGAYPSEAPFSCSILELAPGLTHKHRIRLERLARDKRSSVL